MLRENWRSFTLKVVAAVWQGLMPLPVVHVVVGPVQLVESDIGMDITTR
jgi:hypothetical protein